MKKSFDNFKSHTCLDNNSGQVLRPTFANNQMKRMIDNNLNNNLLAEPMKEYNIYIDSDDRKLATFPDPFNYVVTFKSDGNSTNNKFSGSGYFEQTAGPVIPRTFKNVKYVSLNHVVLSECFVSKYTVEHLIKITDDKLQDTVLIEKHCNKGTNSNQDIKCIMCKLPLECFGNLCECDCVQCSQCDKCPECFNKPVSLNNFYNDLPETRTRDRESHSSSDNSSEFDLLPSFRNKSFRKKQISQCKCQIKDKCHVCNNISCKCMISNNKFLILRMAELQNNNTESTNTHTSDNTFIIHYDRTLGKDHNIWVSRQPVRVFPTSLLYNLDRLTIEFCDNRGNKLNMCIIINYSMVINSECHRVSVIFGRCRPDILSEIKGIKIELPITELINVASWYKTVFNKIMGHVKCCHRQIIIDNYDRLYKSVSGLEIYALTKHTITNNIFLDLGIIQNELNTQINYD